MESHDIRSFFRQIKWKPKLCELMWAPLEAAVSWTKLTFAEKIKLISQLNLCNQKAEKIQKAFSKGNYVVTYCSYSCLLSSLDMYSFLYCIFSRPSKHLAMHLNSLKRLVFFYPIHRIFFVVFFSSLESPCDTFKYLYDYFTLDRETGATGVAEI